MKDKLSHPELFTLQEKEKILHLLEKLKLKRNKAEIAEQDAAKKEAAIITTSHSSILVVSFASNYP